MTRPNAVSSSLHSCQSLFPQPIAQLAVAVAWVGMGGLKGRGAGCRRGRQRRVWSLALKLREMWFREGRKEKERKWGRGEEGGGVKIVTNGNK